jgi:hypothetical protein
MPGLRTFAEDLAIARALRGGLEVTIRFPDLAPAVGQRERRSQATDKTGSARKPTRTDRARLFVLDRVREQPGHRVTARAVYEAYLAWAREREPDSPLSYSAFVEVVEAWAPIEGRCAVRGRRGRPMLAFTGITTAGRAYATTRIVPEHTTHQPIPASATPRPT